MKQKFTLILLVLVVVSGCKERLDEEYRFFGDYDVENGSYKLLVFGSEGTWIDDYPNFYIDDPATLLKMKEQWIFKYRTDIMPCGFGYLVMFVDEDKILAETAINLDCEYIEGWIYFPENYLRDHISSFKRLSERDRAVLWDKYK